MHLSICSYLEDIFLFIVFLAKRHSSETENSRVRLLNLKC